MAEELQNPQENEPMPQQAEAQAATAEAPQAPAGEPAPTAEAPVTPPAPQAEQTPEDSVAEVANEIADYKTKFNRDLLKDLHIFLGSVNLSQAIQQNPELQQTLEGYADLADIIETLPYSSDELVGNPSDVNSEGEDTNPKNEAQTEEAPKAEESKPKEETKPAKKPVFDFSKYRQ